MGPAAGISIECQMLPLEGFFGCSKQKKRSG